MDDLVVRRAISAARASEKQAIVLRLIARDIPDEFERAIRQTCRINHIKPENYKLAMAGKSQFVGNAAQEIIDGLR